jgi:2'-5' RNA ligase
MVRSLETSLVLALHDAEPFDRVRRELHVGAVAKGVPFHITLLYPWIARDDLTDELLADVRTFFARRPPFVFELARIETFPRVVYAAPEPAAELIDCMNALYERFPDTPPYGGASKEPAPHATLAGDVDETQTAREVEQRLGRSLPARFRIDAATLLEEFEADRWRESVRFPLSG